MVRHVILWKLKDMPDAEKAAVKVRHQSRAGRFGG